MKKVSVFTPTYNRAYILPQLYGSLCRQGCDDFEWLIIDDGSTDDTKAVVDGWIAEGKIAIKYFYQENGGKQRAHNTAVSVCETELFLLVDSDDYITDDCIQTMLEKWELESTDEKVAGIIALRGDMQGNPLGTVFPPNLQHTTMTELYRKWKFKGDIAMMFRTKVLKKYSYQVADGEKFIGEDYVWKQIDQEYYVAVLPKLLMQGEYLADGYTKNVRKVTKNNPKSYVTLKQLTIRYEKNWIEKYIQTILCIVGCILSGEKKVLQVVPYKFFGVLAYLPARLAWFLFFKNV